MSPSDRVRAVLLVGVLALAGLTGCVQVPTAGPIERVPGQAEVCQNCIDVEVAPPATGAAPREVVADFLRATRTYQPNYSTARQYLTAAVADSWRPEERVSVYDDSSLVGDDDSAMFGGRLVGEVGIDRTYAAKGGELEWNPELRQENGEWRISNPPTGLIIEDFYFERFYAPYAVYFVVNNASLVPERIYLPIQRNPANLASTLMIALLDGPSAWLAPAAASAIPMGTSLSVASVPITNGIAEVPLNEAVLDLSDQQRSQMAAQIVYTLRQVSGVKGVLITVNSQTFRVPEADQSSQVIPFDAFSRELDPVPFVTDQLYAVKDGRVQLVTTPDETPGLLPMPGRLGQGDYDVESLAVSVNGTGVAAVTGNGRELQRAATDTGEVRAIRTGLTEMLRPQFTRYEELWTIGVRDGRQQLWRSSPDQEDVAVPVEGGGRITAFRISPDGARIALVRQRGGGHELVLARIIRAEKVTVDGWRTVNLTQVGRAQITRIADVAWLDANDLLLLGATAEKALDPVRVSADARRVLPEAGAANWDATQLTVLARPQTAIVIGGDGRIWRDTGTAWLPLLDQVDTVAYAG